MATAHQHRHHGDEPTPIGARVEVTFVDIDENWTFPAFHTIDTEDPR